jgi:hypothetical protein
VARAREPLAVGAQRVVHGTVAVDGPVDAAIQIDVEQAVKNHKSKNGHWHTWQEVARRVQASPFYLVPPEGETVYVEPDERVLVVDAIETKYPLDAPLRRRRVADVRRGEEFFVYGELVRGPHPRAQSAYRDGVGWVLRAPRGARMLLANEAIGDRYPKRAKFLLAWGLVVGLVGGGLNAWLTWPFVAASIAGEASSAQVTDSWTYNTTHKGKTTTHYAIRVRLADGRTVEDTFSRATYEWAHGPRDLPLTIPVVRAQGWTSAVFFGTTPYVLLPWAMMGTFVALFTAATLVSAYRGRLAWYDRKTLDDYGGKRRWNETRPHVAIDPSVD